MEPIGWRLRWRLAFVAVEVFIMALVVMLPYYGLDGLLYALTGEDVMSSLRLGWMGVAGAFAVGFVGVKEYWLLRGIDREWSWIEGSAKPAPKRVQPEGVWVKEDTGRDAG